MIDNFPSGALYNSLHVIPLWDRMLGLADLKEKVEMIYEDHPNQLVLPSEINLGFLDVLHTITDWEDRMDDGDFHLIGGYFYDYTNKTILKMHGKPGWPHMALKYNW